MIKSFADEETEVGGGFIMADFVRELKVSMAAEIAEIRPFQAIAL